MKKPSVTIGIPAYNEAQNIAVLLKFLLRQTRNMYSLRKILVISDGSTDGTVKACRELQHDLITVVDRKKRKGMNETENEIISLTDTDYLIFLNADVLPLDFTFIDKLIKPFLHNEKIGIVGGNTIPAQHQTIIEWVLAAGHELKQFIYTQIRSSDNIYLCHGRVRALSRKIYKNLTFPVNVPEDAFSYLYCKQLNKHFKFEKNACVYFRSPQTLADHARQSHRFRIGKNNLSSYFSPEVIEKHYNIPVWLLLKSIAWFGFYHPVSTSAFIVLVIITKLLYRNIKVETERWAPSKSSKSLI